MQAKIGFKDVNPPLSEASLNAVKSFGFAQMTPVQAATIPLFLKNKDVCVEATTGSGKTLAFGLPIFEILRTNFESFSKYDIGALVVAPTRELASQIFEVLSIISKSHDTFKCGLFVGGTNVHHSAADHEQYGAQVVVGTPGRIVDMKNRCPDQFNLKKLEVLVLDEADTLLDMGFKEVINQILSFLPKQRRTGLFSATQTAEVKELARAGMRNPVTISVRVHGSSGTTQATSGQKQATPSTLENFFAVCEYDQRPEALAKFIVKHQNDKIIVFCATCACVDYYSKAFNELSKKKVFCDNRINIVGLHGKMVPKKRTGLYQRFLQLDCGVMFSTDVAARGVDIPDVDWIVQLASPKDPAFFVHRVGRTARAGKKGGALLLVAEKERPYVELLRGRGVPLREMKLDSAVLVTESPEESEEENGEAEDAVVLKVEGWKKCDVLSEMKQLSMQDRDLLEGGSTAFMSFLRAYKEHICSFIFQFSELDIGAVARSYALLRLPKIPETRGVKGRPIVFETSKVSTGSIPYKHKEKEEARQRRLKALVDAEKDKVDSANQESAAGGKPAPTKWIPAEEYKAREEPDRKRKKKITVQQKVMDEWEELAAEETAFRKFKKGKMSKKDYEKIMESSIEIDSDTGEAILPGAPISGVKRTHVEDYSSTGDFDGSDNDDDGDDVRIETNSGSDESDGYANDRVISDEDNDRGTNEADIDSDSGSDDDDNSYDNDDVPRYGKPGYSKEKKIRLASQANNINKKAHRSSSAKAPFKKSRTFNLQAAAAAGSRVDYRSKKSMKFGNHAGGSRPRSTNSSSGGSRGSTGRGGGRGGRESGGGKGGRGVGGGRGNGGGRR